MFIRQHSNSILIIHLKEKGEESHSVRLFPIAEKSFCHVNMLIYLRFTRIGDKNVAHCNRELLSVAWTGSFIVPRTEFGPYFSYNLG